VALVLLELDTASNTSAFDTVDHEVLLGRLNARFGIKGRALAWFRSYLYVMFQSRQ
jgi:hypothetical protein